MTDGNALNIIPISIIDIIKRTVKSCMIPFYRFPRKITVGILHLRPLRRPKIGYIDCM